MITLTTPAKVNSVLGGNALINYDKFVLASISYDTVNKVTSAQIAISSSANTEMQSVTGTLTINSVTARLTISVPQLGFYRQVVLTGPQNTFVVDNVIRATQNALEGGLVTLGVIAGVQNTGT